MGPFLFGLAIMQEEFWNKISTKYATDPVKDLASYEMTLMRTRRYISTESKIIEFGAGTGSTAILLSPDVNAILCSDFSSAMIEIAKDKIAVSNTKNVECVVGSFDLIAQHDLYFDAAVAFNLLHLLSEIEVPIARVHKHLKPGGYFITKTAVLADLTIFLKPVIGLMRLLGKAPYVNFISADQLEKMMIAAGFEIVESGRIPDKSSNHFIVARKSA